MSPIVKAIAIGWALFQLALPQFLILNSLTSRTIHIAFALTLTILLFPKFTQKDTLNTVLKGISIVITCGAVLYIIPNWEALTMRSGIPTALDIIISLLTIGLVLEITRRYIGMALPIIVIVISLYGFFGPYMPSLIAFKGISLTKYITQVVLSTEGIYGIPIGVAASIIYLFVLFGALLEKAGGGRFFIDLSLALFGKYKGGTAKAAVAASGLMGSISGSSIANIVTTGNFTIPLMKENGYPAEKAAAIEVAASTDGQLMPPIMGAAAFLIAEYVNIPYAAVVKAAIVPAIASSVALFFITHLEASKLGLKGLAQNQLPQLAAVLKGGAHYLIPLGMLMVELFVLQHTPALAAFRTILVLVATILYQETKRTQSTILGLKKTMSICIEGCISGSKNMIPVTLACASAGIIVGLVNLGIGSLIIDFTEAISQGNIFILLVMTAVACLILGMGLPTTATYIVMAALTAPIIVELGGRFNLMIPLIAAHLFCFYFGILADDTPPVGLAAYAAAAIAKTNPLTTCIQGFMYDIRTGIIPFMFVLNTDILLIGISSWPLASLILVMTCIASCTFASAIQGWFITKNTLIDTGLLLLMTWILFYPKSLMTMITTSYSSYWGYGIGLILLGIMYLKQTRYKPI